MVLGGGTGGVHRRVPRRRSRLAHRARRALSDPGRGLSERRVHSVQGAAPCRCGHRRRGGDGRARASSSGRRRSTRESSRTGRTRSSRGSPAGSPDSRSSARWRSCSRRVRFSSPHRLRVATASGATEIGFDRAIVAAGSRAAEIPGFPHRDPRLMDSTGALVLDAIPPRLLVIGGGIIGLEMATVYAALGSKVSVVELMDGLIPGCDRDLVKPLEQRIRGRYEVDPALDEGHGRSAGGIRAARLLRRPGPTGRGTRSTGSSSAVGRRPNGDRIGAENAGLRVDEHGFIPADRQQRTNVDHIFAIGDVAGPPMLAHKATHEGKVAAEVCAGRKAGFDALAIPSVAYTDPDGRVDRAHRNRGARTRSRVRQGGLPVGGRAGRALGIGRTEGLTKVIFDRESGRLLGAGIVGPRAGDLIARRRWRSRWVRTRAISASPSIPTRPCRRRSTSRRRWPRGRSRTSTCRVARSSPATSPVRHTKTHGWRQGEPNPRCGYGRFDRKASIKRRMHPHPQRPARTGAFPAPPSGTATRDSSREATGKG